MNSKYNNPDEHGPSDADNGEDKVLESLFSHASARSRPPEELERETREALHAEWKGLTRRRSRKRHFAFGLAASILLAAVIGIGQLDKSPAQAPAPGLASIDKQFGNIFVRPITAAASDAHRLDSTELLEGQVVSTADNARLAVNWISGESVRLDKNTELVLHSPELMELIKGTIYIDSKQAAQTGSFEITTSSGVVRHLGTQYMTVLNNETLQVSVREGKVRVDSDSRRITALKGQQVQVDGSGESNITEVPTYGDEWDWAGLVTPEIVLDGLSAYQFIHWAARESGRQFSFDSLELEQMARKTQLKGAVDLEPVRALNLILQTSDLEPIIIGGEIRIRKRLQI